MFLKKNIYSQTVGDELLVYNRTDSQVHCLKGELAEAVQKAESGEQDLSDEHRAQLSEIGLADAPDRRDFLTGGLKAAGAALVLSAAMPAPAQAASVVCGDGNCGAVCCPGNICAMPACFDPDGMFLGFDPDGTPSCLPTTQANSSCMAATMVPLEMEPPLAFCGSLSGAPGGFVAFCCT